MLLQPIGSVSMSHWYLFNFLVHFFIRIQVCFINLNIYSSFYKNITLSCQYPPKCLNSQCSSSQDLTVHFMFQKDQFLIFGSKANITIYNNSPTWKIELDSRFSNFQIHISSFTVMCPKTMLRLLWVKCCHTHKVICYTAFYKFLWHAHTKVTLYLSFWFF